MSKQRHSHADRRKHHVIYKTTCKITGRYYIGMHSTDNLQDGYIGSGKRLWQSIKKHGAEQHVCEVLEHHPTREALRLREEQLVNDTLLQDPMCMNLALGGGHGWDYANTPEGIERRRPTFVAWHRAGHNAFLAKYNADSAFNAAQRAHLKRGSDKAALTPSHGFSGRTHSLEAKQKMIAAKQLKPACNPSAGKPWMYNPELERSQKVNVADIDAFKQLGWLLGRKMYQK